jgi:hypothetical protein
MQNSYDLAERDYADYDSLDARMFDDDFENFVVRQVAPAVAEAAPVSPSAPTGAKELAAGGPDALAAAGGATDPNAASAPTTPRKKHHKKHHKKHRHGKHHGKHHKKHHRKNAGAAGAKEASPAITAGAPDAAAPGASSALMAQDPNAPATPTLVTRNLAEWWHNLWHPKHKNHTNGTQVANSSHNKSVAAPKPTATAKAATAAETDAADPVDARELPAEPATPAVPAKEVKEGAATEGAVKTKPEALAAEGAGATKAHPHHHRTGLSHAQREARRRSHLRKLRKARLAEGSLRKHHLSRHQGEGSAKEAAAGKTESPAPVAAEGAPTAPAL